MAYAENLQQLLCILPNLQGGGGSSGACRRIYEVDAKHLQQLLCILPNL